MSTYVSTALVCTATWACTYPSFGTRASPLPSTHTDAYARASCRSTNLDSWQLAQLRTMKVGGNQSATDFFNKHGGATLLADSDTKKKYSSRVAELYKEELAKRAKDDAAK